MIREWAAKKNIAVNSNTEIAASSVVKKRIAEEVEVVNKTLGHYETIKRFELLDREFSIERNEMTPKLSLRRKIILDNYKEKLAKIYKDTE